MDGKSSAAVYEPELSPPPSERKKRQPHGNARHRPQQQGQQQQQQQGHQQQQQQQHERCQDQERGQKRSVCQRRGRTGRSETKSVDYGSSPTNTGELRRLFEETLVQLLKEEEEGGEAEVEAATVVKKHAPSDVARCHATDGAESPRVGWIHVVRRVSASLSVGDFFLHFLHPILSPRLNYFGKSQRDTNKLDESRRRQQHHLSNEEAVWGLAEGRMLVLVPVLPCVVTTCAACHYYKYSYDRALTPVVDGFFCTRYFGRCNLQTTESRINSTSVVLLPFVAVVCVLSCLEC